MAFSSHYQPDSRTPELGDGFFDVVVPAQFPSHILRFANRPWAQRLGLGELTAGEWQRYFGELQPLPRSLPQALALRYHGYQFGSYNSQLGDGRGFLHAQLRDPPTGRLLDLATKGSGETPWSRRGDGRLTLKGGVREVLATELLEALGVYTSKSFSLYETGEMLERSDEPSPTRSSLLVRLSHGHIRFGSFERHAHGRDAKRLGQLLEFAAATYFPHLDAADPVSFFREVCHRTAELAASYTAAGFVHGVLNTDNMNITGESFDYGPYRFLPRYDPDFVAAYFDSEGRYAFGRQPEAMRWNLERLADALSLLGPIERLRTPLGEFEPRYFRASHVKFLARLGLRSRDAVADSILCANCLCFLAETRMSYDQFFFDWYGGVHSEPRALAGPAKQYYRGEKFLALRRQLGDFPASSPERLADSYFAKPAPTTLVINEIESLWSAIAERDDWSAFDAKVAAIRALGAAYGHPAAAGVATSP